MRCVASRRVLEHRIGGLAQLPVSLPTPISYEHSPVQCSGVSRCDVLPTRVRKVMAGTGLGRARAADLLGISDAVSTRGDSLCGLKCRAVQCKGVSFGLDLPVRCTLPTLEINVVKLTMKHCKFAI